MNIRETVFNLRKVYEETAVTFADYQKLTRLPCLSECGRCCLNPEVEATTLEMLPWALKVWDEGTFEGWLSRLGNPLSDHCLLFLPGAKLGEGKCGSYPERPGVCRMFGVAGYKDKKGEPVLSLCRYIRESVSEKDVPSQITDAPLMSDWMNRILSLGTPEWLERRPMNEAMHNALQRIVMSEQYKA